MRVLRAAAQALAWAVLLQVPVGAVGQAQGSRFTTEERQELRQGNLVIRRETQQRHGLRLIGGTSFQVVDAPPEAVWAAVVDVPSWVHFVPQTDIARVIGTRDEHRTIYLSHREGPIGAAYHLDLRLAEGARMAQFRLDKTRPHTGLREGWGFFIVSPYGDDRCMVTFGVMVDVGSGVVTGLVRPRLHEWMLRIPQQLRVFVERRRRRDPGR